MLNRKTITQCSLMFALGLTWALNAQAQSFSSLDDLTGENRTNATHRAYLKVDEAGFTPLPTLSGMDHLNFDFSGRLFELPVIENAAQPVTLLVRSDDFHPEMLSVEAREVENLGMTAELSFNVEEIDDGHSHLIRVESADVSDQKVLLVDLGWFSRGVHGAALAEPEAILSDLYAPGTDHNPTSAEYTLGLLARGDNVPDRIVELHEHWKAEIEQQRARDFYEYVDEAWADYENAEGAVNRLEALEAVKSLAETYLDDFPGGEHRSQAESRLDSATSRLDAI